jgi:hypothetical protein
VEILSTLQSGLLWGVNEMEWDCDLSNSQVMPNVGLCINISVFLSSPAKFLTEVDRL